MDSPLLEELDAITEGKSKLDLAEEIWRLRRAQPEGEFAKAKELLREVRNRWYRYEPYSSLKAEIDKLLDQPLPQVER